MRAWLLGLVTVMALLVPTMARAEDGTYVHYYSDIPTRYRLPYRWFRDPWGTQDLVNEWGKVRGEVPNIPKVGRRVTITAVDHMGHDIVGVTTCNGYPKLPCKSIDIRISKQYNRYIAMLVLWHEAGHAVHYLSENMDWRGYRKVRGLEVWEGPYWEVWAEDFVACYGYLIFGHRYGIELGRPDEATCAAMRKVTDEPFRNPVVTGGGTPRKK